MLAQGPSPVIKVLKGENAEIREAQSRNNRAALGRGPGSLRDLHNNIPFFFFLTLPSSLLDAISPTRDQRHAPCSGRVGVLTVGPPGKPHVIIHGGALQDLRPPQAEDGRMPPILPTSTD